MSNETIWQRVIHYETTSAASSIAVLDTDLMKMIISSESGVTTSSSLIKAVRLRAVKLLGSGDGTGSSIIVFEWSGARGPDRKQFFEFGATSLNKSKMYRPPQGSFAGMWNDAESSAGTGVFTLDMQDNNGRLLVDIHVELVIGPGLSGPTVSSGETQVMYPSIPLASGELDAIGVVQT